MLTTVRLVIAEGRDVGVCGTDIHDERVARYLIDGKADAVDTDRAFRGDVACDTRRQFEAPSESSARPAFARRDQPPAVDVTADEVPAETFAVRLIDGAPG